MRKGKKTFDWLYLLQAEDSTTLTQSRLAGACKAIVWVGVSILIGMGVSQLT
jgi:hypothetical protein